MAISSYSSYDYGNLQQLQQAYQSFQSIDHAYTREDENGDEVIKVDKGSPDKALYAIFYAEIEKIEEPEEDHDPVIFCKTRAEVDKEMAKLLKRRDVDISSVRIFGLCGVVQVHVKIDEGLRTEKAKK